MNNISNMNNIKESQENQLISTITTMLKEINTNGSYDNVIAELSNTSTKKSIKSKGKAKRPLTEEEYNNLIHTLINGVSYIKDNKKITVRPNYKVALALVIEANTGLRISDVLKLKVSHFLNTKLELHEKKTNKLQYRKINSNLVAAVNKFALENNLQVNDYVINLSERTIQKYLKIVVDYFGYENIGTHSFRKYFTMHVYNKTKDLKIVQTLLNHSSIVTTERYLGVDYEQLDKISESVNFTDILK